MKIARRSPCLCDPTKQCIFRNKVSALRNHFLIPLAGCNRFAYIRGAASLNAIAICYSGERALIREIGARNTARAIRKASLWLKYCFNSFCAKAKL